MAKEMPKRLFTVKEAALYLGLPTKRIYEAVRKGATRRGKSVLRNRKSQAREGKRVALAVDKMMNYPAFI